MNRFSRDLWLTIGLLLVLVLITIAAAIRQTSDESPPPLASFSNAPGGARALRLWVEELGFGIQPESGPVFRIPQDTSLVMILEPTTNIGLDEWEQIDKWVEDGGTLILAGQNWAAALAMGHYEFQLHYLPEAIDELTSQTPLPSSPAIDKPVPARPSSYLESPRSDYITHLAYEGRPVLVSWASGEGRVILSAAPYLFSNAGLKKAGNPDLVLNLVATASQRSTVWFDEWHHGIRTAQREIIGPGQWLRYTPAGRSLLYVAGVLFLVLLVQGRAFGRPIPLKRGYTRRAPSEYITALANLNRRAGHRGVVMHQFHQQIKRQIGRRHRINPTIPDDEYVAELVQMRPDIDADALLHLLTRLRKTRLSEREMVQLAREASQWLSQG